VDLDQLVNAVDALAGHRVAVRIVVAGEPELLLLVAQGRLGSGTHDREPAYFWPIDAATSDRLEQPGLYVHGEALTWAKERAGGILLIRHGPVIANLRPLD
jgi:hypothetical protein